MNLNFDSNKDLEEIIRIKFIIIMFVLLSIWLLTTIILFAFRDNIRENFLEYEIRKLLSNSIISIKNRYFNILEDRRLSNEEITELTDEEIEELIEELIQEIS